MHITVIGAGAWGTALALAASVTHQVHLWVRDPAQAERLRAERVNARYLPGVPLPPGLVCAGGDPEGLLPSDLEAIRRRPSRGRRCAGSGPRCRAR